MEQELISGVIAAVVFQNPENGYAVIKLTGDDGSTMTVVGTIPMPIAGERLLVTGKWITHSTYGSQFEAEFLERLLPDNTAAIFAYLSSKAVRGIGEKTAEKIVKKFGEASLKVLDTQPERLAEIEGISVKKALDMGASFRRQVGVRRLIEYLSAYRIPAEIAVRFYRVYGERAMDLVQENPYRLAQAQFGASFTSADMLAIELGFDGDDDRRVEAAVLFELRHNLGNGHIFIPREKLAAATATMLSIDVPTALAAVDRLSATGQVQIDTVSNLTAVYLPEYYEAETYISERISMISALEPKPLQQAEVMLDGIERLQGIHYAALQREAIRTAAEQKLLLLTGGPGTGKTTTLAGILSVFDRLRYKTLLAAPTGRAAKRLSELTHCDASTIHRLLEAQISPDTGEMYFARSADNPLECDALIVDETSMVDLLLMHNLLLALPEDATLILVGDPDQLPSVGAGNLFSDLINSETVPTVALTEIFRQARESLIVMNAHAVNHGELPVLNAKDRDVFFLRRKTPESVVQTICELCATRLPAKMGIPASEIQVISPTRKGETGTFALNSALQAALNPPSERKREMIYGNTCFREGDRVMQIRNNYDLPWKGTHGEYGTGVFNGDVGEIVRIDPREDAITISFDGREAAYEASMLVELELAYAMTAHKSQGSEYRAVIFVPFAGAPMLLTRGVLYTAITRARELLVMVGNEEVIAQMTQNNRRNKRYSALRLRLRAHMQA